MQYITSPVDGSSASQSIYQQPIQLVEEEMCSCACWRHVFPPWRRLPRHHYVPPENCFYREQIKYADSQFNITILTFLFIYQWRLVSANDAAEVFEDASSSTGKMIKV